MKNIAIIGAGQLGSRHLQSLALIDFPIQIDVVDPFEPSLKTAEERYNEYPKNPNIKKITFRNLISDIENDLDLVIIATNADIRAEVTKELLSSKKVKNLILEKVLFQKPSEYTAIDKLLKEKNIPCWVNHPRRCSDFYKKIKNKLSPQHPVYYQVQGGDWGLGCNAIHFIDHLSFLTGKSELDINTSLLDPTIQEGKRKNYKEFTGALCGNLGQHKFVLYCHKKNAPLVITITSEEMCLIIDQANGWYRISERDNKWEWSEKKEKIIDYQSELTHKVTKEIITNNKCDLTPYSESMSLHLPLIEGLISHINLHSDTKYDYCPIT